MGLDDVLVTVKAAKDAGLSVDNWAGNVLDKPTKELGEGLGNLFWLVFSPIHAAKIKLEKMDLFKANLVTEVNKISEENRIEPPLNVVGPALEASKYYIDDDNIRIMFAKLIASSMDITNKSAHPSFVEIIKQLSPFDATLIKDLYRLKDTFGVMGVDVAHRRSLKHSEEKTIMIRNLLPFEEFTLENHSEYLSSFDNLIRLKLIDVNYEKYYLDENRYRHFIDHPVYNHYLDLANKATPDANVTMLGAREKRGMWGFTIFGKNFIRSCL